VLERGSSRTRFVAALTSALLAGALLAGALLAGALLAAGPASAGIINARAIGPPGESGFVSVAGLLKGQGSPHLYDQ